MERVLILERMDLALKGNIRTEKKEGGDWRMDGEKKVYGTYGEGGIRERGSHLECKQRIWKIKMLKKKERKKIGHVF